MIGKVFLEVDIPWLQQNLYDIYVTDIFFFSVKKQNWKKLDLPTPKRERGVRRSEGRGSDSVDWRADARSTSNNVRGRGGGRGGLVRGRGRGRGTRVGGVTASVRGGFRSPATESFDFTDFAGLCEYSEVR